MFRRTAAITATPATIAMRTTTTHLRRTILLLFLFPYITFGADSPTKLTTAQPAAKPAVSPISESSTELPAAEMTTLSEQLHCFQCTGVSTDPDDHCTDSGWISIPREERLDYRHLCPDGVDEFCMKTIERWDSTRPGVADTYRTRRGCSAKTRTR